MKTITPSIKVFILMLFLLSTSCENQKKSQNQNTEKENEQTISNSSENEQSDMVATPFGLFRKDQIHSHPAGSIVRKNEDGSATVTYLDGTVKKIPASDPPLIIRPSANGLPISHAWLNYASFYTSGSASGTEVGTFKGNIIVPNNPTNTNGQVLYYFTGIQDNSSSPLTILQPVLGYNGNGATGWSLSSWNCCPSGQPQQGNVITGMEQGDTIYTKMSKTIYNNETYYAIEGTWNGQVASLSVATDNEFFNWPNVTLEVYDINECSQFAAGPITFFDLELQDQSGNPISPTWDVTGQDAACNTNLTVVNETEITIEQNN